MLCNCLMNGVETFTMYRNTWKLLLKHNGTGIISKRNHGAYDHDGKTTVNILNKKLNRQDATYMIKTYSQLGFRLVDNSFVSGPLILFPHSVLSWNIAGDYDINERTLALFLHLVPKLEMLVIGVGDEKLKPMVDKEVLKISMKYKMNIESQLSEKACSTYNFLVEDNKHVAAALIPPFTILPTYDDVIETKERHKKIHTGDGPGDQSWLV